MALGANEFTMIAEGGKVDAVIVFSDEDDTYNLEKFAAFPLTLHKPVRLMGGSDYASLATSVNFFGWDNNVNGNSGNDNIYAPGGHTTRSLVRGGADQDKIDLEIEIDGGDWLAGGGGDDEILSGNVVNGYNVIRGNRGNDKLKGGQGNDVIVGDFGRDTLTGQAGRNIFLMRTDDFIFDGTLEQNATSNINLCDQITDFVRSVDYIVIPGIARLSDLTFAQHGDGVQISANSFTNGTSGLRHIAWLKGKNVEYIKSWASDCIIVGDKANSFFTSLNTEAFLGNPNLPAQLLGI